MKTSETVVVCVCVRELGNFGQYDGDDADVPNAHPGADMGQNFENF